MKYQREEMTDKWFEEVKPLMLEHWKEASPYFRLPLDPEQEFYVAMEQAGYLRLYTARLGEGLVGYSVFFVRQNPQTKGSLQATCDAVCLSKEHRGRGWGPLFLRFCDEELAKESVQFVHYQEGPVKFGSVLRQMGCKPVATIYLKRNF